MLGHLRFRDAFFHLLGQLPRNNARSGLSFFVTAFFVQKVIER